MGSLIEVYIDRANNEIMVAESLKRLSEKNADKEKEDEIFEFLKELS